MERFVKQTLLFDFYGELLTDRQQETYRSVVLEDYSLSEVAKELGISRQAVHEMIKRCNESLEEYESKLNLVERFLHIRDKVRSIHELSDKYHADDIAKIAGEILEEL